MSAHFASQELRVDEQAAGDSHDDNDATFGPTVNVHVPKGGCIIFRGDTIHAAMHDKGRALRRLHVYIAKGTAAYVNKVVDNKVHFIA